ncbi:MAG: hypothetical protein AAF555_03405 [Verrucomicrobiota bacterium]
MKPPVLGAILGFLLLAILHQDEWNWDNGHLVFGFLPVGLAYHAAYSLVVALFWALVIRWAWPRHLEDWADQPEDSENP